MSIQFENKIISLFQRSGFRGDDVESQSEAALTQSSTLEDTDKHDKNNEEEIENSLLNKTNSTSSCTVATTNLETQRLSRIEIAIEKQRKLLEETFKDDTKKIHHFSICKDRCDSLSFEDPQSTSKNKHRFKHSILMDKTTSFLACLYRTRRNVLSPVQKPSQFKSKEQRYFLYETRPAIQKRSYTGPFQIQGSQSCRTGRKHTESIPISKREVDGVTHMKHFNHSSAGSIREMFLSIGDVITEDLVQEVNMADSFGLMIDEVTDISLLEQLVCFIQYVDRAGCPTIHFLFTADLLKESDSADAATIVKSNKGKVTESRD
ncbi:unnamed protein product [Mytilus coruscus]|uniref:DUF4371 domain-containing protein n=1 Tax=Mytilus coruscus TaxID=42192 RepID=A0A6J8C2B4_MYTCO|nr:unnamed protein product [Mytilus coruscus]